MQSIKYMEELNSTRLLQEISNKLPLKSGSRWCRQSHDVLKKTERTVSFHDLVAVNQHPTPLHNPTYKERSINQNTPESTQSESAHSHQARSEVTNDDRDSNLNVSVCSAVSGHGIVTNSLIIPVYVFRKSHPSLKSRFLRYWMTPVTQRLSRLMYELANKVSILYFIP